MMRRPNLEFLQKYMRGNEALSRKERISERLPHFYKQWKTGSSIFGFTSAMGTHLDESEKDQMSIMRTHWVDTASGGDLEKLGSIYNIKRRDSESDPDYRNRLKTAIMSYKGGGTKSAIQMIVRMVLKLPLDYPVKIEENPIVNLKRTWKVSAGKEWVINPRNIEDAVPDITLKVTTENAKVTDITLTNLTTSESISFKGDMLYGDILKISNGQAKLNDKDATDRLSTTTVPMLVRRKSKWQYKEYVGANLGVFDSTQFDRSVFVIDIISEVTFEWTARQPAAFILELPNELLTRPGITVEYMQHLVNLVKAAGVKAELKVV
jgi:hypothetical protein